MRGVGKLTSAIFTGAPFQWAAIFHKKDLHFENGAEGLAFYHSPTKGIHYELPVKVSCAYCHSPIMDEGRNMVLSEQFLLVLATFGARVS